MCPGPAAWAAAAMRQFGRETVIDPYPLHALVMVRAASNCIAQEPTRCGMHACMRGAQQLVAACLAEPCRMLASR